MMCTAQSAFMSGTSEWLLSDPWEHFGYKSNNFLDIILEHEIAYQNYASYENILGLNMWVLNEGLGC